MSINTCTISGNLGKDPEYKVTRSGTKILNMFLAVNERIKDGTEWKDYTNWIGVTLFGRRAESLSKFLRKGMKVCVSGHLRYSAWESDNGNRRSKVEVIADEVDVMQKQQHDQQQGYQQQENSYTNQGQYGPQNGSQGFSGGYQQGYQQPPMDVYSSDMPF